MFIYIKHQKKTFFFRLTSRLMCLVITLALIFSPTASYAQTILNLPIPGALVLTSPVYNPAIITGLKVYPDNPLQFDFIIDTGDDRLEGENLKKESQKLINYFMATLTVPEEEMWVNLSPYEKDRIIAKGLSQTEMGRDMLAQDYLLKQLTASLMYPENDFGKSFWDRVHTQAQEKFGTIGIPMNTFNKIWIVPQNTVVYVHDTNVFVAKNHLKVMLEEDYLALESNQGSTKHGLGDVTSDDLEIVSGVSADIVREILLPEIEREVNEGKNFANLRQMYNSMLLATWYKKNFQASVLSHIYANQNKVEGIDLKDTRIKEKIYDQYVKAFKKGVYNYIKEDVDSVTKEVIPRKYFSGGIQNIKKFSQMSSPVNNILDSLTNHNRPFVSITMKAQQLEASSPISVDAVTDNLKKAVREYVKASQPGKQNKHQEKDAILLFESYKNRQDSGFYIYINRYEGIKISYVSLKTDVEGNLQKIIQNRIAPDRGIVQLLEGAKHPLLKEVYGLFNQKGLFEQVDDKLSSPIQTDEKGLTPGGIDFNPNNVDIKEEGEVMRINFSSSALENFNPENIRGIVPVITNIIPLPSILPLLGLEPSQKKKKNLKFQ